MALLLAAEHLYIVPIPSDTMAAVTEALQQFAAGFRSSFAWTGEIWLFAVDRRLDGISCDLQHPATTTFLRSDATLRLHYQTRGLQ
jgi:hypothetical protein